MLEKAVIIMEVLKKIGKWKKNLIVLMLNNFFFFFLISVYLNKRLLKETLVSFGYLNGQGH